jgi:sugar phosphate isomerase/epimerase
MGSEMEGIMNDEVTRRNFLTRSASIAGSGMLAGAATTSKQIGDVKPAIYSITYLGYWYRGEALSMDQLIDRARKYGYEGIEIEGKRPHGFSLDWPKERCLEYRKRVADAGLVITNVASDNDFSSPISEHREAQMALVKDQIRMTSELGSRILRIYLAWAGATKVPAGGGRYDHAQKVWDVTREGYTNQQMWDWCRECFIQMSRIAGDHGVTLALQNHKPMITGYKQVLQMIKEVGSPHFKACIDAPLMENTDPEYLRKAVYDTGSLQVHTHFGGDYVQEAPGKAIRQRAVKGQWRGPYIYGGYQTKDIYTPFIQALFETGYRGYIGYELCHPLDTVNGNLVGLDYAEQSCHLAATYIKGIIAEAKKRALAA